MNNVTRPFVVTAVMLLLLNLAGFWIFDQTTSALIIFTAISLLAYLLAWIFFYRSYLAPLEEIIDLVHQRYSTEATHDDNQFAQRLAVLLENSGAKIQQVGAIDRLLESFTSKAQELSITSSQSAISAAEVSYSLSEIRNKLEIQAQEISQVAHSGEQITETGQQIAENSSEAQTSSQQALQDTSKAKDVLSSTHDKIGHILKNTEQAYDRIEALSQNSDKIKAVTQVIDGIANQTNLLALNAAIEAARAGDMGRGFAVVADEVRGLAARTTEATQEVGQIIDENHKETGQVVELFKTLAEEVKQGTGYIQEITETLGDVSIKVADVESRITVIAQHAADNHQHQQKITGAITTINEELGSSRDHIQQLDEEAEKLTDLAENANASLTELNFDGLHQRVYKIARQTSDAIEACFEASVASGEISLQALFDRQYKKIENTNPVKFHTSFDEYTDRVLPAIQDSMLKEHPFLTFCFLVDDHGYVPTHNERFSKPLTGDYQKDLVGNRTKRIFDDKTGQRCAKHTERLLLQTYKRDTGEVMHDLSIPIYVQGRHWGGFRVGYIS